MRVLPVPRPVLLLATAVAAQPRTTETLRSDKAVRAILRDQSGAFWLATDGDGVCRFDGTSYSWITAREGLASDFVRTIRQDAAGTLRFETRDGITRYDGRTMRNDTTADGLPSDCVTSSFRDASGTLWFGTASGGVTRFDGKRFVRLGEQDRVPRR